MPFQCQSYIESEILIIEMEGKLTSPDDVQKLSEIMQSKYFSTGRNVVFDCKKLNLLVSSGLNIMVRILTKSRVNGGETVICNLNPQVFNVFNITKLDTIFKICLDKEEAINFLKQNN